MTKNQLLAQGIAALLAAPASWAACSFPATRVSLPDGASATEAQMAEAQAAVKGYLADLQVYLTCLDTEEEEARAMAAEAGEELSAEEQELHVKRHNAAVDAMHAVAEEFNVEVREFKARDDT